jgi:hypothetical protein
MYTGGAASFFGGRIALAGPLSSWLAWRIDAGSGLGSARDPLGTASMGFASAGLGVVAAGGSKAMTLGIGPRFEAGAAWFSGKASVPSVQGSSGAGAIAAVTMNGLISARITDAWGAILEGEAGIALKTLEAKADDRTVTNVGGPLASIRAGFSRSL